ncbi:MAG TPA: VOC family protein, partial [Acidimicrobiales bacterium]|nr:VOC family protein [Acidimicrobiales bacterium]
VFPMSARWYTVVVDCQDHAKIGRFWSEVLGMPILFEDDNELVVAKDENTYPGLLFLNVPGPKESKNRLHIDLAPDDRDAEVERILALGATKVDIGQTGEESWVVLADPEGNEFCVLSAREGGV